MTIDDIERVKEMFVNSAQLAMQAGYDAVEIHAAEGMLIDQFLRSGSNRREDEYGGSVENRCRFLLEIIDRVTSVIPSRMVGVKLSPVGRFNEMRDDNPKSLLDYLIPQLD